MIIYINSRIYMNIIEEAVMLVDAVAAVVVEETAAEEAAGEVVMGVEV
jgi:hypothetical protein